MKWHVFSFILWLHSSFRRGPCAHTRVSCHRKLPKLIRLWRCLICEKHCALLIRSCLTIAYFLNHRAEEHFHRAMQADPTDGEVLGKYANFLWRARGDKVAADRAFRAALASDPDNPYHAGNYSHFTWHEGDIFDSRRSRPTGLV